MVVTQLGMELLHHQNTLGLYLSNYNTLSDYNWNNIFLRPGIVWKNYAHNLIVLQWSSKLDNEAHTLTIVLGNL